MSVEVKTPTRTQFEHAEFQCGEKQTRSNDKCDADNACRGLAWDAQIEETDKDDNQFANTSTNCRKRRTSSFHAGQSYGFRRKRLKSMPCKPMVLPTKFLLGGNINDPLNLDSMNDKEINRILNEKTPQSSPIQTPAHRKNVEVKIPSNISDPLNLNIVDEEDLTKTSIKKKKRHKYKKKDESLTLNTSGPPIKDLEKRKGIMEALKIDIDSPDETSKCPTSEDAVSPSETKPEIKTCKPDVIVSPVIPQISPKSRRRRRTMSMSDVRPEVSAGVARAILRTSLSPPRTFTTDLDKSSPTPPKRFRKPSSHFKNHPCHKNPKFIYGNYNRYYGYRNVDTEDHRLDSFQAEWFCGKDVLDIGCNVGHLTLAVARNFCPKKIVGMDIDGSLISAARKNIRHYLSTHDMSPCKYPVSNTLSFGPIAAPPLAKSNGNPQFPNNVVFLQGNIVLETDELLDLQTEEFDVILALSLTKWIHLNFGDDGLKRTFKRIFKQLRPGGKLILEPQPWSSYKKKKKLTETIHENFKSIKLKPDQFSNFLLQEVGFSTCAVVDVPFNKSKGFRRPIQLYTKPKVNNNNN